MRALVLALALLLLSPLTVPAHAQTAQNCQGVTITPGSPDRLMCSKTFYFFGTFGSPTYPGEGDVALCINAWENTPISIYRVTLDGFAASTGNFLYLWGFSGNSFNADPMTNYGGNSGTSIVFQHSESKFPAGISMQFPSIANDTPPQGGNCFSVPHIDVHYDGTAGVGYQGYLMIWYTSP